MPALTLTGCAPVPLAHYLKALGVLRLVSEQADPAATACWNGHQFILHSNLDREALTDFFLNTHAPTAVIAPWNGGSGFYPKDNDAAISAIERGQAQRMQGFRECIRSARKEVERLGLKAKPENDTKRDLLLNCRSRIPETGLGWLDAVVVLGQQGVKFPPLLGTGGNDGRFDFTNNFMQRLTEVMDPATGDPTPSSAAWLRAALFAEPSPGLTTKAPIGQFFPGAAGGANATSGFDGPSTVNPWDFIFMIEGAVLFAAATVKKLETTGEGALVYPFCVRQAGVGYASAAGSDEANSRCEMWLPLWDRPASLPELRAIFAEGRAQVRGRPARNGVDFAQAVVTLGVDRGIAAFQRYGFQIRNGLSYFATPLDRLLVRRQPRADLLADIEHWHDRLRQKASGSSNTNAPASVVRSLQHLERRILDLCRDGGRGTLLAVLVALGGAERALARSFRWTKKNDVQPLQALDARWFTEADDGSPEFRLAAALASVRAPLGRETLWLRPHLEPVEVRTGHDRVWVRWDEVPDNDVVWQQGHLADSIHAILARRLVRFEKAGVPGWPDRASRHARLDDITAFIEGRVNEDLLADLLWGMAGITPDTARSDDAAGRAVTPVSTGSPKDPDATIVPSAFYALLKLCHHCPRAGEAAIPLVPAILNHAMNGDGGRASMLAARRLQASGMRPLVRELPIGGESARRTAAAMLFPISHRDYRRLTQTITHQNDTHS